MKSRTSSKRVSSKLKRPQLDNDLSMLHTSSSGPSSPTGMSLDAPILSPSLSEEKPPLSPTLRRSSCSESREQLIYTKHRDGLLNENKQTFEDVDFCFVCEKTVSDGFSLTKTLEKTGYKLDKEQGQLPVYRMVFLCVACQETTRLAKLQNPSFSLKITLQALTYFSVSK